VLGASGFIGRWVARALVERGAHVVAVGVAVGRDAESVRGALGAKSAPQQIEVFDLEQPLASGWLSALAPDVVFNLAGYGVDRSERDAHVARRLNKDLVAELTDAVAALGASDWPHVRLVHAGSALEYGTTGGVLHEGSPTQATTLYGETKLAGTVALVERARASKTRAIVARLFTVYGAGEHAGRLLPTILAAATSGADVPLSDGLQRRDFAYVEDVAEGLLRLAVSGAAPGDIVNLATGVMQPVRKFVEVAAAVAGVPRERLRFGAVPTRPEEMSHTGVSVKRLEELTGWHASPDLQSGVRRTLIRL
jgi:nucleoside-diphosphate-sugar epimerase